MTEKAAGISGEGSPAVRVGSVKSITLSQAAGRGIDPCDLSARRSGQMGDSL